MGAAYFIVLDHPDPGFDTFVNGKAVSRDAERLSQVAKSLGLKTPDEYFSVSPDDARAAIEAFGGTVDDDMRFPPEQWFTAHEGLAWVAALRAHLQSNPIAVRDAPAVLADLAEYERVLTRAKAIDARWHFAIDA